MRVLCYDVVPVMLCDGGRQKRIEFSDVFFTKASDVEFIKQRLGVNVHLPSVALCATCSIL